MPGGEAIAAIATAPGHTPRAIVRVSGPALASRLDEVLRWPSGAWPARRAAFPARLSLGPGLPVLAAFFPAPRSFTGEDVLEITLAGGPALVERVLARLTGVAGVRPAQPGEFSARAFLHGRLTLEQAEGVAALIAAGSTAEVSSARALLDGTRGEEYRAMRDETATLLALVEAGIDFADQDDVRAIEPAELRLRTDALRTAVERLAGPAPSRERRAGAPLALLCGAPSAGKSTLFNALLGLGRAATSPNPGTTRDVLEEPLDLSRDVPGAGTIVLADAPGLDDEGRPEWSEADRAAQAAARGALGRADVLVWCDPTGRFDEGALAFRPSARMVRVRTKADQPGHVGGDVAVCALDGRHLDVLRRALADAVCVGAGSLVPSRHARALARAGQSLDECARAGSPETQAHALREALDALGEIAGAVPPDEVLGRIFASFCVGK